ncbi:MAG: hypothetical protein MRZ79_10410 [Bacteroidia bacterium]|nr:hypothetical protein [Bacteroidia bacterium]
MRIFLTISLLLAISTINVSSLQAGQAAAIPSSQKEKISDDQLSQIALGSAVLGAILIAIPPLSIFGLAFGLIGLGLGIFSKRKAAKKLFAKLAIVIGSLVSFYFLLALGLVTFY